MRNLAARLARLESKARMRDHRVRVVICQEGETRAQALTREALGPERPDEMTIFVHLGPAPEED